jgi:hypothetical protein
VLPGERVVVHAASQESVIAHRTHFYCKLPKEILNVARE